MIIPLAGDATVAYTRDGRTERIDLAGRDSVFEGPADILYLGAGCAAEVSRTGRIAVAEAVTAVRLPPAVLRRADVPVLLQGTRKMTQQVHNFGLLETEASMQ